MFKPNYGHAYRISKLGIALSSGGPELRRAKDKKLNTFIGAFAGLVYYGYRAQQEYDNQFEDPGEFGGVFKIHGANSILIRTRFSEFGFQLYFDDIQNTEHLTGLLLPPRPGLVSTKTVRDNAQYLTDPVIAMRIALQNAWPISQDEYHKKMGKLRKNDNLLD